MFTLRNVANLVPPYEPHSSVTSNHGTFASVEFAVNFLKVRHIVVLGHRLCGGVKALLENAWEAPENVNTDDHLACWMSTAVRAKQRALAAMGECDFKALWNRAELETVRLSVENLGTFPCVKEAVAKGKLQLHGLHFDFSNGHAVLKVWNSESGEFEDIDEMEELWGDDEHVITS
jgi:carbonic anhydrase